MNKTLIIEGEPITLEALKQSSAEVEFVMGGVAYRFRQQRLGDGTWLLERELSPGIWQRSPIEITTQQQGRCITLFGYNVTVDEAGGQTSSGDNTAPLSPAAPMPGVVCTVSVAVGDSVTKGSPLAVMEAMKLQLTLYAGGEGVVEAILVSPGDKVAQGQQLIRLIPKGEA